MAYNRVIVIVLDGAGIGNAPDAHAYNDSGADTLGHIWNDCAPAIPNLLSLGLGRLLGIEQTGPAVCARAYGTVTEASAGKDTTIGHWEIAGIISREPFPVYPEGFPAHIISAFESIIGTEVLGNVTASGTEIIELFGPEHMATGKPIVYTSADSVFQIAAHEDRVGLDRLYAMCRSARGLLTGKHSVARVIARPFIGSPGNFIRTANRRDFSNPPPGTTVLDHILSSGQQVTGIGKIDDIFAGRGITRALHTSGNAEGIKLLRAELLKDYPGLIFVNLVDFDVLYGHRRDTAGFAAALEYFDASLPGLLNLLQSRDTLIITADHGNDPTFQGTDHTRECLPLLALGRGIPQELALGSRDTLADIAATISDLLDVADTHCGRSFAWLSPADAAGKCRYWPITQIPHESGVL